MKPCQYLFYALRREQVAEWKQWGGFVAALFGVSLAASGQSVEDYAVRLSALVQTNPARITLSWPGDPRSTSYTVSRKSRDATVWGSPILLAATATNYADPGVGLGIGYEYRVVKVATNPVTATNYVGEGYLYTGFGIPLVENRGKIILVVDSSH